MWGNLRWIGSLSERMVVRWVAWEGREGESGLWEAGGLTPARCILLFIRING